jgi:hypothetical protein
MSAVDNPIDNYVLEEWLRVDSGESRARYAASNSLAPVSRVLADTIDGSYRITCPMEQGG